MNKSIVETEKLLLFSHALTRIHHQSGRKDRKKRRRMQKGGGEMQGKCVAKHIFKGLFNAESNPIIFTAKTL